MRMYQNANNWDLCSETDSFFAYTIIIDYVILKAYSEQYQKQLTVIVCSSVMFMHILVFNEICQNYLYSLYPSPPPPSLVFVHIACSSNVIFISNILAPL